MKRHKPTNKTYNLVAELMESGTPVMVIAETLAISYGTMRHHYDFMMKDYKTKRVRKGDRSRDCDMCDRFRSGETLQRISEDYNICRERVRQILARYNLTAKDGGQHVRMLEIKKKRDAEAKTRQAARAKSYGVDAETFKKIRAEIGSSKIHNFYTCRFHAINGDGYYKKPFKWSLTLQEYVDLWKEAGLEVQQEGYRIARKNRNIGFTKKNIKIMKKSDWSWEQGRANLGRKQ